MKVIIREAAYDDLDRISVWIAKDRPRSADSVIDRILESAERLGHFPLDELQSQFAPDNAGSALKALDRRAAVIGVKQPIDLRAASFHEFSHALLSDFLFLHFTGKLVRDYCLGSGCGDRLADSGFGKPAFEAGPYVRVFACHDCNSFNLCFASTNSSAGVFCVFLMMACSATSMPS